MANSLYTGAAGARYEEHRFKCRSNYAQRTSAQVFLRFAAETMTVVDFGCGNGGILANIPCAKRIGVEINEAGAVDARARGIEVFSSVSELPDACADLVISHHALEHVPNPYGIIVHLRRILRPGGRVVIVVPCELPNMRYFRKWTPALDVHLYSWNPRSLGNIVHDCGFTVEQTAILSGGYSHYTKWLEAIPVLHNMSAQLLAWALGRFQVTCVARVP